METHYSILEIPKSATPEEIKQAYRLLLQVWHPDRFHHNPDLLAKAEKKTREINVAFATLSNPALKQRYDEGQPASRARQEPRMRKPSGDEVRTTRCPNSVCASILRVNATTVGIVTCPSCRTTFRYDPERDEKWDIISPEGNEIFTPARMAMSAIVLVFAIVAVWTATAKTKTIVSNKPAHAHTDDHETLPSNEPLAFKEEQVRHAAGVLDTAEPQHEHMDPLEPIQRQMAHAPGRAPSSPPDIISDVDLQQLKTLAAQGSAWAQSQLGQLYANGWACRRTMQRHGDGTRKPPPRAMRGRRLSSGSCMPTGGACRRIIRRHDSGGSKRRYRETRRRSSTSGSCIPTGGVWRRTIRRHGDGTRKPPPRAMRGRRPNSGSCMPTGVAYRRTTRRHGDGTRKPPHRATRGRRLSSRCCSRWAGGCLCDGTAVVGASGVTGKRTGVVPPRLAV